MTKKNLNLLNSTGFLVNIKRLGGISLFANSITLPGLNISNPEQPNPFSRLVAPADRLEYDQLVINFNVDEELTTWLELVKLIKNNSFPDTHDQFKNAVNDSEGSMPGTVKNLYTDIEITVLNNMKNPLYSFVYYDCLPLNISPLDLSIADSDIVPIVCSATFEFSSFSVFKPGTTESII